jgi:hypothetical protein
MTFFLCCNSRTDYVQLNLTQGNLYLYNLTFQTEIKSQKSGLCLLGWNFGTQTSET